MTPSKMVATQSSVTPPMPDRGDDVERVRRCLRDTTREHGRSPAGAEGEPTADDRAKQTGGGADGAFHQRDGFLVHALIDQEWAEQRGDHLIAEAIQKDDDGEAQDARLHQSSQPADE